MNPARRRHLCRWDGSCRSEATCVMRLYVPPHAMSVDPNAEPLTVMLGLPLCDAHFRRMDARRLLEGERGVELRERIAAEFRRRNAMPDFAKAAIGRIGEREADFGRFETMQERTHAN